MKVLVIGSGGREHALVWKLKQSKKVSRIFCLPGNGGIANIATCVNIKVDNTKALVSFAQRNKIGLTVVGPEVPLAKGIVDEFQKRHLRIFGPDKKAARLESSKIFAKEFMRRYHIPTAPFAAFETGAEAIGFCKSAQFPIVIKADGLAAGKGAVVAHNLDEATRTLEDFMIKKTLGSAGDRVLIESFLVGQEVSIMAVTDGKVLVKLPPSQDHKQAYDGDRGPNTGGMGAYCPARFVTRDLLNHIETYILKPTIKGLKEEGTTYRGVIYTGLMLTETGPKVLEYNCRFGDPETQVVLPLLKSDLLELMMAVVSGKLGSHKKLDWSVDTSACVIMASKGYPGRYSTGIPISGLHNLKDGSCYVFHAGTQRKGNRLVTSGGRVLAVTGTDKDLKQALNRTYRAVNKIRFEGATYRRDIGCRANRPEVAERV